ncbi:MAG: hypothetical protein ABI134_06295 [Byssovorax sp.]
MNTEVTSFMIVIMEISRTESCGGMTAQERSALVEQFGISEELLLRCERAHHAFCTTIFVEQRREARMEAILRMRELGKKLDDPQFGEEITKALDRIWAATPENEITRERTEAFDALRAALDASTSTPKK